MTGLAEWLTSYPGLFLVCAVSGIAIPIPEDIPLLYAGIRVADGDFTWAPTILAAMSGVLVRDILVYGAGRCIGDHVLQHPVVHRFLPSAKIERARKLVHDHGAAAVLAGRFMVGLRAPVFFVAGTAGVGRRQFIFWDILGMLIAVPVVMLLGFTVGPPVIDTATQVARSGPLVWGTLAVVIGVSGWLYTRKNPKTSDSGHQTQV